jgi:hypothetical protein
VWEYVDPSLAADKVERLVAPLKPSVIGRWVPDLSAGLDLLGREGPLPDLTTAPALCPSVDLLNVESAVTNRQWLQKCALIVVVAV